MTTEEIKEGNKLIAEFMGAKLLDKPIGHTGRNVEYPVVTGGLFVHSDSALEYHSSWEWLMHVVEKVSQLCKRFTVMMDRDGCYISVNAGEYYQSGRNKDFILQHYIACVEFIKWFNSQPKQSDKS